MSTPPQLPSGYQLDEPAGGPPKLPAGYQMDQGAPAGPPPPPSYLGEAAAGLGRAAKGVFYDLPKAILFPDNPFGIAGNLYHQTVGMLNAGAQAAESGEGRAGQTLAMMENAPIIGGMVQKAEQAGPGRIKFAPQTLGAATEAVATAETPKLAKVPKVLNEVIPSTTRAGAGLSALERQYAAQSVPVEAGHAAATDIVNRMAVTGENAHPLIHVYLDRVVASDLANTHPELTAELAARGYPTENPLTFAEARQFLKRANELKYEGGVGATARNQLSQFAKGLDQDINASAQQGNFFQDYSRMKNEYRRGSSAIRAGESPMGKRAGGAIGAGVGATLGAETGIPHAAWGGAGIGYKLGEPLAGSLVRSVIEREAGPPNISTPPAPPIAAQPPAPPVAEGRRIASEPVSVEQRVGGERRADTAARAKFAAMTPEQQYQVAFTNPVTGMPNARAFKEAGPAASYGMSDVAGLKWLNDTYGQAAGDLLLQAKARALQQAGLEAYHTGGDEFKFRGVDSADLNNRLVKANEILRNSVIRVTDPKTGQVHYFEGAEFRHGVGPTTSAAEQGMLGRKAAQKATRGTQGTLHEIPRPPEALASD